MADDTGSMTATDLAADARVGAAPSDDPRWPAVLAREERDDFVYAVRTTRVYCRPSCPSRRPRPENVAFFATGADAEEHGYRACRRCRPDAPATDERLARVEAACRRFDDGDGLRVADVAAALGTSADALRRDFRRVLGVSPKQYADGRRVERLRAELRDGRDVTDALYTVGYGSSSRLYEQSDARLGMTPASYGAGGAGATIAFTAVAEPPGCARRGHDRAGHLLDRARRRSDGAGGGPAARVPRRPAPSPATTTSLAPVVDEVLHRIDW